jgi:hypothetical protein
MGALKVIKYSGYMIKWNNLLIKKIFYISLFFIFRYLSIILLLLKKVLKGKMLLVLVKIQEYLIFLKNISLKRFFVGMIIIMILGANKIKYN